MVVSNNNHAVLAHTELQEAAPGGNLKARTSAIVLLSIAALLIVSSSVASLSETTSDLAVAAQATDLKGGGDRSMPDSFRVVNARMEEERRAFHNSQSHHKGRRLLDRKKAKTASSLHWWSSSRRRRSWSSLAWPSRQVAKNKGAKNNDAIQEFFGGSPDCKAAKGGEMQTVALKKGGGWTPIGGWKSGSTSRGRWGRTSRHSRPSTEHASFIFLRLSSEQNKCQGAPSGVCMDKRSKTYHTAAAAGAALKNPPAHSKTWKSYGFPKRIGSVGQCFAKCKHVPWYNMPERAQKSRTYREMYSCKTAHALECKTDGGKTGFIDWHTNKWRTCVKNKWGSWKAQ